MSNTRNLADLLDSSGDVKSAALDNVPATDISGKLNTSGGTLTGTLIMESTDAGNSAEPELILYRNSPSPSSGDYLGQIQFKGENANGGQEIYAKVTGKISDPTHSSEDGLIETAIKGDGSFTIVSRQKADELQLINGVNLDVAGNIIVGGTVKGTSGALDIKNEANNQNIFIKTTSAGSEITALKIHSGGVLELPSGGLRVGGTAAANTLDDYEEGNHSASFTTGNSGSITMGRSSMGYVKIGKVVTVTGEFDVSSVSSPIGGLRVSLPFTIASHTSERNMSFVMRPGMYHVPHNQDNPPLFIGHAGTSHVEGIYERDDASFLDYNPAAGETMWFCFSYFTDS